MVSSIQKAKYVLPAVVNPATSKCFLVPVPDEPQHIAAFRGAMFSLAKAYNWQDDPYHTAKDVAAVWSDVYDNILPISCDTVPIVPFSCNGDFSASAEPFGVWTLGYIGQYVSGEGYGQTTGTTGDGWNYAGVRIGLALDSPLNLSHVIVHYDYTRGTFPGTHVLTSFGVLDQDNSAWLNTLYYDDEVPNGTNLTKDFGASSAPTSHLYFVLHCDQTHLPLGTGVAFLNSIELIGTVPPGSASPC